MTGKSRDGFSLIELLIIIIIIGLLTSIAINSYRIFKIRAYNNAALYDLRNLINDELAYYGIKQEFVGFTPADITSNGIVVKDGFTHRYVSNEIRAVAKVNGNYANFCTKHKMGDLIYGYETESDMIYYKESQQGYELQASDCPDATENNDFSGWKVLSQKG
jgi:prepilin-type N-terminal cleavage/methylation domain-containing protein